VSGVYATHADLGGTRGHGPVRPEPDDERFPAAWEPRALAVTLAMGATGAWNIDMSRAARETLPDYARLTYYEVWIRALEALLRERGLVAADEIAAGRALHAPAPVPRVLHAVDVPAVLAAGSPTERRVTRAARYAVGQAVRLRATPAAHHTRLPGYARGKRGVIERVNGMHVYADAHAQGLGEDPQWLYTVVFGGAELWPDADAGLRVSIDAWEPYLEAAA
jgi:nitrile hydratase beta subunit